MWYIDFVVSRDDLNYEGEDLEKIAEEIVADGYGGAQLDYLTIKRAATDEEENNFRTFFKTLSEDPGSIRDNRLAQREEERARLGLETEMQRYRLESKFLNEVGLARLQKWTRDGLKSRFYNFESSKSEQIKQKYMELLEEEMRRCSESPS